MIQGFDGSCLGVMTLSTRLCILFPILVVRVCSSLICGVDWVPVAERVLELL